MFVELLGVDGQRVKELKVASCIVLGGSVLCDGRQFCTFCGIGNVKKWGVGVYFQWAWAWT